MNTNEEMLNETETIEMTAEDGAPVQDANPSAFWSGLAFVVFALAIMTLLCRIGTKK